MRIIKNRIIFMSCASFLFLACFRQSKSPEPYYLLPSPGYTGGYADAIFWTTVNIVTRMGKLTTEASTVPTCTGSVVEMDGKHPILGALIVVRIPRASKIFTARSQADGSFTVHMKAWWTGPPEVQVTALAKFHGRAETITGRPNCQNLVLKLPTLSEKEWHAFRDDYVQPVITAAKGPMWDLDGESRSNVDSFAKVLY